MNKKAVFFSILSIFLIILFLANAELITRTKVSGSELAVTRTRVKIMNSLVNNLETFYLDKILYVSSKNALVGLSRYFYDNNFKSNDYSYQLWYALNMTLKDGLYNNKGTIVNLTKEGCGSFGNKPCMNENFTLNKLQEKIKEKLSFLGIDFSIKIEIKSNYVKQINPWNIEVTADIDYEFKDKNNIASWKGFVNKKVNVSVYGIYANFQKGIITNNWRYDNGTATEPYVVSMLEGKNIVVSGLGICPTTRNCDAT